MDLVGNCLEEVQVSTIYPKPKDASPNSVNACLIKTAPFP